MMKRSAKRKQQRVAPKQPTPKLPPPSLSAEEQLRKAIEAYVSLDQLRELAAYDGEAIQHALLTGTPPEALTRLLRLMAAIFTPLPTEQITSADDAAALLMTEMSYLAQEQFRVIYLDTKSQMQAIETIAQGTLHGAEVRMCELFRPALRYNSASVILAHNHPSGDPTPSRHDLELTRGAIAAGKLLGVRVVDHLIIGRGEWISLRRESPVFADPPEIPPPGNAHLDQHLWLIMPE